MIPCVACAASGTASNGGACTPCKGTGVGPWVSPSQVALYKACQRKWYYRYPGKVPTPQHASASLGTEVHATIEAFYRTQEIREAQWDIAAQAFAHLPAPSEALHLEKEIYLPRAGFGYYGLVDILDTAERTVYDHKTSGDPKRYAIKEDALRTDPQAVIYAGAAVFEYGWEEVKLQWTYIPTKGRGSVILRKATLDALHIADELDRIDVYARDIVRKRVLPASECVTNENECIAYGGCPYRGNPCDVGTKSLSTLLE